MKQNSTKFSTFCPLRNCGTNLVAVCAGHDWASGFYRCDSTGGLCHYRSAGDLYRYGSAGGFYRYESCSLLQGHGLPEGQIEFYPFFPEHFAVQKLACYLFNLRNSLSYGSFYFIHF